MCLACRFYLLRALENDCPLFFIPLSVPTPDESSCAVPTRSLGPMGEDIEPMIDREMFLQMMESMDKDGDGTVTKASHTIRTHTHASAASRAHIRELIRVACTRGPAARVWSCSAHDWFMAPQRALAFRRTPATATGLRSLCGSRAEPNWWSL